MSSSDQLSYAHVGSYVSIAFYIIVRCYNTHININMNKRITKFIFNFNVIFSTLKWFDASLI